LGQPSHRRCDPTRCGLPLRRFIGRRRLQPLGNRPRSERRLHLPAAIYLGGNFEYFFGDSVEGGGLKIKSNIWQLSAEGGYDIGLGENFVIRPKVGAASRG
jgi:hypothetical protein